MPNKVNAINSSKLLISIGNGNSPETFTHPCMINTQRGIEFGSSPTETLVPYCPPDEDLAAWIDREMDANTAQITGSGVFDHVLGVYEMFVDWHHLGLVKNIRVYIGTIGYHAGAFILPRFNTAGGGRREKVTFDCTMLSDGVVEWHATT